MPDIITNPSRRYRICRKAGAGAQTAGPDPLQAVEREIARLAQQFNVQDADGADRPAAQILDRLGNRIAGTHTLVIEATDAVRDRLAARFAGEVDILDDFLLHPQRADLVQPFGFATLNFFPADSDDALEFRIRVTDQEGRSIAGAKVTLAGGFWIDEGITNAQGRVKLTLFHETPATLSALAIQPAQGFWSRLIRRPLLVTGAENAVTVQPLGAGIGQPDFPASQLDGWGMEAMGIPGQDLPVLGTARVAVIDSGLDTAHPDIAAAGGFDHGDSDDPTATFVQDGSGHGTHVAGTVAAIDNRFGVLGAAGPGVELFAHRVFPDARVSKIEAALDWCIDNDVDIVNLSLGSAASDDGFDRSIAMARQAGVLCIAAAGNSGGPVMYPAAYPSVIAVAALGRQGTFPDDSMHALQVGTAGAGAWFAAKFTCRGPEIDLCAPGVAVISTMPGGGYAAWDGTSMACPHVAGLAARLLQTRSDLRALPRGPARAAALAEALLALCADVGLPAEVQGRGLPVLASVAAPSDPDRPEADTVPASEAEALALVERALAVLGAR
ncbi:MAG: S8 family serine peptidase [Gemmobacter sp.]